MVGKGREGRYKIVFLAMLGVDNRMKVKRYMDDVWVVGKYKKGSRIEQGEIEKEIMTLGHFVTTKGWR